MEAIVNVIHPHTYRCVPDNGIDYKVVDFLNRAKDARAKILIHNEFDGNEIISAIKYAGFKLDTVFGEIFRNREIEKFYTLPNGFPRADEKPKNASLETWEAVKSVMPHSELRDKIAGHYPIIFLGGFLERCVGNAAAYCAQEYGLNGIFCLEDLSLSLDKGESDLMKKELEKRNVRIINSQELSF